MKNKEEILIIIVGLISIVSFNEIILKIAIAIAIFVVIYKSKYVKKIEDKHLKKMFQFNKEVESKEIELKENILKYKNIIQGSQSIILCFNITERKVIFEKKIKEEFITIFKNLPTIENSEYVSIECKDLINSVHKNDRKKFDDFLELLSEKNDETFYELQFRVRNSEEQVVWLSLKGRRVYQGDSAWLYGLVDDISILKERELYDELTQLPNTMYLKKKLAMLDNKNSGKEVYLVSIKLYQYKIIRYAYEKYVADEFLKIVSKKIQKVIKDDYILFRTGNDKFSILIDNGAEIDTIKKMIEDIKECFKHTLCIRNNVFKCDLNIGVSSYKDKDSDELIKTTDLAIYNSFEEGKNKYKFFEEKMLNDLNRDLDIEKGLSLALSRQDEDKELFIVMQPKVDVKTGETKGLEVLVRWVSKEFGFVSPAEFIPVAEKAGIINHLGRFILEESFRCIKELTDLTDKYINIAINISEVQLRDSTFIDFVKEKLEQFDLDPKFIQFEITETIMMKFPEGNRNLLNEFKELGISIALDDFGTGYSSLNYLRELPLDVLKIDKSFVDHLGQDDKSEIIIFNIIKLAHELGFQVVVEGVETKEQVEYLKRMECDFIQGYYFSKPRNFSEIKEMLL